MLNEYRLQEGFAAVGASSSISVINRCATLYLQQVANIWVIVDHITNSCDELDHLLGHVVG